MSVFFFSLCIGLLASAIGTNTGGTGLLIVPALVVMGLPPHIALGSSRIGALGGMVSGWYAYHKSGNVHTAIGLKTMILTSAGALVGSFSLLGTPPDILEPILGICIIGVTALFLLMKTVGTTRAPQPKAGMRIIGYIINIPIGFFGAYVGGGSGILGRMALMFFFGQNVIESNGTRKLQSIGLSMTAATVFFLSGNYMWPAVLGIFTGTTLGAYVGSILGLRAGENVLRTLFILMTVISALLMIV